MRNAKNKLDSYGHEKDSFRGHLEPSGHGLSEARERGEEIVRASTLGERTVHQKLVFRVPITFLIMVIDL